MAPADVVPPRAVAPVASVWCRQVDNEAESPGYTSIPDDFPGYRETLESIRIVGNLTVNVADTHDYWDPGPSQSLSFYPNLFLYPAAGRRYTCVGRMFLSTEDRPRLGMKTLVFSTAELVQSGEFGRMVLRAHATMDGRGDRQRLAAEPDPSVFQAVGDGFLFAKGSNDPVVIVASDQWEAAAQAVLEIVAAMPAALVALGAFLVFPYFLPAGKVNFAEFAEQLPTALAVMRVARGEAVGERHDKRVKSWEEQAVTLRDLTKPAPGGKKGEALPLVLQYVRDHDEEKGREVARRVDAVEVPRLGASVSDSDHAPGKEVRKEMWRIGAAMETAAILLSKPKGRSVPMTGESAKRANQYLQAEMAPAAPAPEPNVPAAPTPAVVPTAATLPAWLRPAPQIATEATDTVGVPVSTSDDPSLLPGTAPATTPPAAGAGVRPPPVAAVAPAAVAAAAPKPTPPPTIDPAVVDARIAAALKEQQAAWLLSVETRLRDTAEAHRKALDAFAADLGARLTAVEGRPVVDGAAIAAESGAAASAAFDAKRGELDEGITTRVRTAGADWAKEFRAELARALDEFGARAAKSEEELRTALVAQLDVEVNEARAQGTTLREEIEGRVRTILDERLQESDKKRVRETHDLEQRLGVLVDGRSKDLEGRLTTNLATQKDRLASIADERMARVEQRIATEREARIAEVVEAHTEALAGLQVRMQSFVETSLRENLAKEREQFLGLLARLKTQTDEALARAVDAQHLETLLRERFAEMIEAAQADRAKEVAAALAPAEARLRTGQQELAARLKHLETTVPAHADTVQHIERAVRRELDDFDRRLKIVHDHVLPMVRQTWLKVSQQESGGNLKEFRAELESEIQRVEAALAQQTGELRDQLETAVAQHGRIWLNLIHEISREESAITSARNRARRPHGVVRPTLPPPAPASPPAGGEFPPEAGAVRRPRRG